MKKALIITYYWPPSGGSGVQRWLKFVKYLRDFGWEPVVYTPLNGEFPEIDPSLEKDVPAGIEIIKTPIWEPYSIYKKLLGRKKEEKISAGFLQEEGKQSFIKKASVWVRGNFFIPDARRFWIKPSVRFLTSYLGKNPVDVIISTGPPHSMHLIALKLKRRLDIPWLADFRDPWTNIDFYDQLMLSPLADRKHKRLEMEVLSEASAVTVIGPTMKKDFETLTGNKDAGKIHVITNGYDTSDVAAGTIEPDRKFSITHIGTMVETRNPLALWKVLAELCEANNDFAADLEIKLVGKVDHSVMVSLRGYGLEKYLNKIDYMPHSEVTRMQQQVQVLLLVLNNTPNAKGILTGKFFEYLSAKRPILAIGPTDGDAAKILAETKAGEIAGFKDEEALKKIVQKYFNSFKNNKLTVADISTSRSHSPSAPMYHSTSGDGSPTLQHSDYAENRIEKYSRKNLSKALCELLNSLLIRPA